MPSFYDNAYEHIRTSPGIRRLEIGEFLFAQFTCVATDPMLGAWAPTDLLVHVARGKKTYRTHAGHWLAEAGQTVFLKKGAYVLKQHIGEDCPYRTGVDGYRLENKFRYVSAQR